VVRERGETPFRQIFWSLKISLDTGGTPMQNCNPRSLHSATASFQTLWVNCHVSTLTGSICLTVFLIYCVCLFPFAKFFFFFHLCCATTCVGEIKLYIISHQVGSMKSTERVVSSYKKQKSRMMLANAQEAT